MINYIIKVKIVICKLCILYWDYLFWSISLIWNYCVIYKILLIGFLNYCVNLNLLLFVDRKNIF